MASLEMRNTPVCSLASDRKCPLWVFPTPWMRVVQPLVADIRGTMSSAHLLRSLSTSRPWMIAQSRCVLEMLWISSGYPLIALQKSFAIFALARYPGKAYLQSTRTNAVARISLRTLDEVTSSVFCLYKLLGDKYRCGTHASVLMPVMYTPAWHVHDGHEYE